MMLHPDKINSKQKYRLENRLLTLEECFNKKHNNKFDYSESLYRGMAEKIEIICPIHGSFWQVPESHKNGVGCSKCSDLITSQKNTKPLEITIHEFKKVHGNRYDYSLYHEFYNGAFEKSKIICDKHGIFMQEPTAHKCGSGCPQCAFEKTNYSKYKDKKTLLYYVKIDDYFKIGLSQRSVDIRFCKDVRNGVAVKTITTIEFDDGWEAYLLEQQILNATIHLRINKDESPITVGWTEIRRECFLDTLINTLNHPELDVSKMIRENLYSGISAEIRLKSKL